MDVVLIYITHLCLFIILMVKPYVSLMLQFVIITYIQIAI